MIWIQRREFITLLVTRAVVLRDPSGALASGLLLQSYPLHPPGRPRDLRIAHLPALGIQHLDRSGRQRTVWPVHKRSRPKHR